MAGKLSPRDSAGENRKDLVVFPQIGHHPQRGGEGHVVGGVGSEGTAGTAGEDEVVDIGVVGPFAAVIGEFHYTHMTSELSETGEENLLFFERLPFTAFSKTYNTDFQVPDSAGTITAMLSGVKTRAGVIGEYIGITSHDGYVRPNGQR
jgi:hypothetical protein